MFKTSKLYMTLGVMACVILMGSSWKLQELVDISTKSELDKLLKDAGSKLVVLTFHAPWCEGCSDLVSSLRWSAAGYTEFAIFVAVNVDKTDGSLVHEYSYTDLPTTTIFKNKNRVSTIKKAKVDEVKRRIAENIEFVEVDILSK